MADKSTSPDERLQAQGPNEDHPGPRPDNFDAPARALVEEFGQRCKELQISGAVCIVHTAPDARPLIFGHGHPFDTAALLAQVLRNLKAQILADLQTD